MHLQPLRSNVHAHRAAATALQKIAQRLLFQHHTAIGQRVLQNGCVHFRYQRQKVCRRNGWLCFRIICPALRKRGGRLGMVEWIVLCHWRIGTPNIHMTLW